MDAAYELDLAPAKPSAENRELVEALNKNIKSIASDRQRMDEHYRITPDDAGSLSRFLGVSRARLEQQAAALRIEVCW